MSEVSGGTGDAQADGWASLDSDAATESTTTDTTSKVTASPVQVAPTPPGIPPHFAAVGTGGGGGKVPVILWVAISIVLAGFVGTMVVWGFLQLNREDEELRALDEPIVNASEQLADAEDGLRDQLRVMEEVSASADLAAYDRISCWYSYPAGEDEPNDFVRCGPVTFADSVQGTYWLQLPVRFTDGTDGTQAAIGEPEARRTTSLDEGEELRRPDGRDAPDPDDIDLERPPAAVAEDDTGIIAMRPNNVMIEPTEPEDGTLQGFGHSTEVLGYGTTDRVLTADMRLNQPGVFAAPDEQEWLLFELEHLDSYLPAAGSVSHSLQVDDATYPFSDDAARRVTSEGWVFAALVPKDADEIALTVTDDVLEQHWSFTSGSRHDDAPEILYRDPDTRVAEGGSKSLPYTVAYEELPEFPELPEVPDYEPPPLPEIPEYEPPPLPEIPEYEEPPPLEPIPTLPPYEPEPMPTTPTTEFTTSVPLPSTPLRAPEAGSSSALSQSNQPGELTVGFDEARLHYGVGVWEDSPDPEIHVASGRDRALLYLTNLDASWIAEEGVGLYEIGPAQVSLVLEDGTEAENLGLNNLFATLHDIDDAASFYTIQGFAQVPVWDVPADMERATLRITPGDTDPGDFMNFDYQGGTIEFTLEFGG